MFTFALLFSFSYFFVQLNQALNLSEAFFLFILLSTHFLSLLSFLQFLTFRRELSDEQSLVFHRHRPLKTLQDFFSFFVHSSVFLYFLSLLLRHNLSSHFFFSLPFSNLSQLLPPLRPAFCLLCLLLTSFGQYISCSPHRLATRGKSSFLNKTWSQYQHYLKPYSLPEDLLELLKRDRQKDPVPLVLRGRGGWEAGPRDQGALHRGRGGA